MSNNEIYFQKQKKDSQQQQKHFDALKISNENSLSINNKVPKRGMGSQTKNKTEASKRQRIEFTYNDVDSSNSVCGLNACCKLIGNTCG